MGPHIGISQVLGLHWEGRYSHPRSGGRKGLRTPGCSPLFSPFLLKFTSI